MGRRISDIVWNFSFQGCVIHLLWPWSHFWRMKMKSLWRKNNEKRSLFVFAKQVTFSRTRKVSTNKDTIKKFSKFASLTSIYYRGYYVGPQSFIRICTEVQFLLKFWGQEGNMCAWKIEIHGHPKKTILSVRSHLSRTCII